jgi:hypothetical protein
MVGQLVKEFKGDFNANHSYPIDSLTAGNYLVRLLEDSKMSTLKVVTIVFLFFFECKRSFHFTEKTFFYTISGKYFTKIRYYLLKEHFYFSIVKTYYSWLLGCIIL